jgi:hypothetical protein
MSVTHGQRQVKTRERERAPHFARLLSVRRCVRASDEPHLFLREREVSNTPAHAPTCRLRFRTWPRPGKPEERLALSERGRLGSELGGLDLRNRRLVCEIRDR